MSRIPTLLLWTAIVVSLVVGFWGWVYQGYEEDAGTGAAQTWPIGVGGYALAGAMFIVLVRRKRPDLSSTVVGLAVLAVLTLAAVLSIDAGNP